MAAVVHDLALMNPNLSDSAALLPPVVLGERDARYLRKAIAWSHAAVRRGNRPFGAVIVSAAGEVLTEAANTGIETHDSTGHAEINAIRALAGRGSTRDALAGATLYASGEPCVMCAGAIFLSAIGRVVFGIDAVRLRALMGEQPEQRAVALSCRDIFDAAPRAIECVGPALIDEASAPHVGAWEA